MPEQEPRLRGNAKQRSSPYPLGQIPHSVAVGIGRQIVHRLAVGNLDITGDDFGTIFAEAISGEHRAKPLGIADVVWEGCAWSVKTVKDKAPFTQRRIRAISGRNSVNYSQGITDPLADVSITGQAVLKIWNARVNESLNQHDDLRIFIMVRHMEALEFTLFESEAVRYVPQEYRWEKNHNGNLEGYDIQHREHRFSWQPHGSQFTVIHHVPASAYRFRITKKPALIEARHVMNLVKFDDSWIQAVPIVPMPC